MGRASPGGDGGREGGGREGRREEDLSSSGQKGVFGAPRGGGSRPGGSADLTDASALFSFDCSSKAARKNLRLDLFTFLFQADSYVTGFIYSVIDVLT